MNLKTLFELRKTKSLTERITQARIFFHEEKLGLCDASCFLWPVFIAEDYASPNLNSGDLVAFKDAGAYGAVMSSIYNSRLLIPEVIAQDTKFAITKNRPSYEDLIKSETIPSWI